MKCGGKVKYGKGGKLPIMQTAGGVPPNCESGYIPVGDKCIPAKITIPENDYSLYNKKDPFTVTGENKNPFGINKDGFFAQTKCDDPTYKYDFTLGKCVPDPDKTMTLQNTKIENGNLVNNGTFTIPKPGSAFKQSIGGCPDGQQKNLLTGKCEPIEKPKNPVCEAGYIYDAKQRKCIKDKKIPGNVVLEKWNSLINNVSKLWASHRDFNNYYNQQIDRMNLRQPIPDWATNEQKQVPPYNPYVKKGGIINFKEGGTNMKQSITNQTTKPPYIGDSVQLQSLRQNMQGRLMESFLKERLHEIQNPHWMYDEKTGNLIRQSSAIPFYDPNRIYKEASRPPSRFSPFLSRPDIEEMQRQSFLKERLRDLQNPNIPSGYMIQTQDGQMPYIKKVGGLTNNKTNNMIKIKKENKGKFTAQARRAGMGVQEFADYVLGNPDRFTASTVKRANFAKNSAGWKKEFGGMTQNNPYYSFYADDNYQDGGPMPMQGGEQPMMGGEGQGGQDQLQQIIMMIVEALKEGMSPEDILAALVKMGIPEEQAAQLLQAVIEKLQGGGGQGQMQGQEMEQEGEYEEDDDENEGMGQQAAPMMAYGGQKMPIGIARARFSAAGNLDKLDDYGYAQGGGQMKDEMNMTIKAYAQMKRISPEEVMQMIQQQLQSVSPQQQDQALQSIMQSMQMEIKQGQKGAEAGQMQQEQGMMRIGGMKNYYR
jgi:hypothetical protein